LVVVVVLDDDLLVVTATRMLLAAGFFLLHSADGFFLHSSIGRGFPIVRGFPSVLLETVD
jgi:hypothetical protein